MAKKVVDFIARIKESRLFKDSFWAVYGNGLGYGLLLVSGIIIARLLGNEIYGEYGLVKTTMFLMASFAAFGLNYTATKYIAEAVKTNRAYVKGYAKNALTITTASSMTIAAAIVIFAGPLADFLNAPGLKGSFQLLGGLIVLRSLIYTLAAILAGFGAFKTIARNNVISGLIMLAACYPFTVRWGLTGAFAALVLSQVYNAVANYISYAGYCKNLPPQQKHGSRKEMMFFSLPIALQEVSYAICNWVGALLITRLSTLGELGIYSATAQWNAVILFIPTVLINVVLAHLSKEKTEQAHVQIIKRVLLVNFVCAFVPFVIVYALAGFITSLYGSSFAGMNAVLRVFTLATVFSCCSKVLYTELISLGKTWFAFSTRLLQDVFLVAAGVCLIMYTSLPASLAYAAATVLAAALYFGILLCSVWRYHKSKIAVDNAAERQRT